MNPVFTIQKKRDGQTLAREEIAQFIHGFVRGEIADYQMAALAMAIFIRGMDGEETALLTEEMLNSGAILAPRASLSLRVDKHSTGGIGDKISLVLAPLLACCGLKVPMLSGRGLGPSGGTLDKLEAIPGYRSDLSADEIETLVDRVGCVVTGQTADLVPADRKLYALRDVTATVPSLPLITASILSKKLAEKLSALVLDVKCGSGAFMKSSDQAAALAVSLVSVAGRMGLPATALISDMNQPLGRMSGNAAEVREAIATLLGHGPADVVELTLLLGAELLVATGKEATQESGMARLRGEIGSGRGLAKFREMVSAQGGDPDALLPLAPGFEITAPREGYITGIDGERLGYAIIALGGGRRQLADQIDPSVGLEMFVRRGDRIFANQPLVRVFANQRGVDDATRLISEAFSYGDEPPAPLPLVYRRITAAEFSQPATGAPAGDTDNRNVHTRDKLIAAAASARERAYARYSNFRVGAALLTTDGDIFTGCNVENASYGLTQCAERAAVTSAVAAGRRQFAQLAIATSGPAAPCGACRQVLAEFNPAISILMIDVDSGQITELRLDKLLPGAFRLECGDLSPL